MQYFKGDLLGRYQEQTREIFLGGKITWNDCALIIINGSRLTEEESARHFEYSTCSLSQVKRCWNTLTTTEIWKGFNILSISVSIFINVFQYLLNMEEPPISTTREWLQTTQCSLYRRSPFPKTSLALILSGKGLLWQSEWVFPFGSVPSKFLEHL